MEAEREKEVSSLQVQSSQGAPPAVVLDSDDEEDAMRSRTRSLHIAPRKNGIERGSRATQGWGLASSLSWARPRVHSRLLHCPFCLSAAGSTPRLSSPSGHHVLCPRAYRIQACMRTRTVRIVCYRCDHVLISVRSCRGLLWTRDAYAYACARA